MWLIMSCSGELLLDQQRFEDAVEKFDKAIELENAKYVYCPAFLPPITHNFAFYLSLLDPKASLRLMSCHSSTKA